MLWTVLMLLDGPEGSDAHLTLVVAHVTAPDAEEAAYEAYRTVEEGEPQVVDLLVYPGRLENHLGPRTDVVRHSLNN